MLYRYQFINRNLIIYISNIILYIFITQESIYIILVIFINLG